MAAPVDPRQPPPLEPAAAEAPVPVSAPQNDVPPTANSSVVGGLNVQTEYHSATNTVTAEQHTGNGAGHAEQHPSASATAEQQQNSVNIHGNPNTAVDAPPRSRIFVGNLASERTSEKELSTIFQPYGNILEVIVRRSFGFVQFDNPQSAAAAVAGEQNRSVGGMRVDLSIADNRNARKRDSNLSSSSSAMGRSGSASSGPRHLGDSRYSPEERFSRSERGSQFRSEREGRSSSSRSRKRSPSPPMGFSSSSSKRSRYPSSSSSSSAPPKARILFLSSSVGPFADHVAATICRDALLRQDEVSTSLASRHSIQDEIIRAERSGDVRYVILVDRADEHRLSCQLTILRQGTVPDTTHDCPLLQAAVLIRREELFAEMYERAMRGWPVPSDFVRQMETTPVSATFGGFGGSGQGLGLPQQSMAIASPQLDVNQVLQLLAAATAQQSMQGTAQPATLATAQQVLQQHQQLQQQPHAQIPNPSFSAGVGGNFPAAAQPFFQSMSGGHVANSANFQQTPQPGPSGIPSETLQSLLAKLQRPAVPGSSQMPAQQQTSDLPGSSAGRFDPRRFP